MNKKKIIFLGMSSITIQTKIWKHCIVPRGFPVWPLSFTNMTAFKKDHEEDTTCQLN